jgi:hypothetical protein
VLAVTGCGTRTVVRTVTVTRKPPLGESADQQFHGHIVSMQRSGRVYLMRFDPSWLLNGVTANAALGEPISGCLPIHCPSVPNDVYEVDESHRALVFLVPATTRGTVLSGGGVAAKTISASQLAQIVAGHGAKLFEPLESGVWIDVHVDTVTRFAQQYRP